jgi:5-methylcytosine-specific restriction enzyme B
MSTVDFLFYSTKRYGSIIPSNQKPIEDINPIFDHINTSLHYKKQVILYGPPGTGKTWCIRKFVENSKQTVKTREISSGQNFYFYTINPERDNYKTLLKKDVFLLRYLGKSKNSYQNIQMGDIVFLYVGKEVHKIVAVAECTDKDEETIQTPKVRVKILRWIEEGPQYSTIKSDNSLSESKLVRYGPKFVLIPLYGYEGLKLLELSGIAPESIGISFETTSGEEMNCRFVTFHPSFSYEEFIEGLRPVRGYDGQISYEVQEGIFKEICREAYNALLRESGIQKVWEKDESLPLLQKNEKDKIKENVNNVPFFLAIDEINRGDISRIFGELITLLEADKRLFEENEICDTILPYSRTTFGIPPNLYLLGTMNTADKSIALIDIALRRRFNFIELSPDYEFLRKYLVSDDQTLQEIFTMSIDILISMNNQICGNYDRDHQIGHSYLVKMGTCGSREEAIIQLRNIFYYDLIPLLQEYYYDSPKKFQEVIGESFVEIMGRSFTIHAYSDDATFIAACKAIMEEKGER